MSNNAIVSIQIDNKAQRVRSLLPIPSWATRASLTPASWLCPPSDVVQRNLGRQLLDPAHFVPPPMHQRVAYARKGVEGVDPKWTEENWGYYKEVYVAKVASFGGDSLHLLCLWEGVGETSFPGAMEAFFRQAADNVGAPFRVLYADEFGAVSGRIDTADDQYERYAPDSPDSSEHTEITENLDGKWAEWSDFWMRWEFANRGQTAPWGLAGR